MGKRRDIAQFIRTLREVDPRWMRERFSNGACYELYRLLASAFPGSEPWIAKFKHGLVIACHVYTRYGDEYFDILGPHRQSTILKYARLKHGRFNRMTDEDHWNASRMNARRLADQRGAERG